MGLTEKSYESQVEAYKQVFLSSTEEQWDKRRDAINNLKSSIKEAVLLRNFVSTCLVVTTQIIDCIKSERTQLCNLAMDYVEEISKYTKSEFDPLADHYLSVIMRNCGRTNKIVRLKAGNCLMAILSNSGATCWFPKMLQDRNNENKDIRLHVAKALNVVLDMDPSSYSHYLSPVEESIMAAIADASSEVREFGFESYRKYFQVLPEREQPFRSNLDISTLKTLEKLQARQAATNKSSKRPAIADLKKQMKAKMTREKTNDVIILGVADTVEHSTSESTNNQGPTQNHEATHKSQQLSKSVLEQGSNEQTDNAMPSSPKRPVENFQVNPPPAKRIPVNVQATKPQLSKSLFGAPKRIPASNTNISQPLSQSHPTAVVRPKSSIGVYRATVRPNNEESVRSKSVQSNHQPSTGLRRTNLTLGGAQRILKKPEPVKKAKVESKIPLQSQNRTTKTPFVKPVATQPTAKVSSGMPTPNSKRTVSMIPTQPSKRPHSPPTESIPVKDTTKLPKPTRSNTSNFSRPTASSNARVSATTEELRRKESSTRSLAANSKVRKVIGTTGPLRVLRGN